jgi:hypothetical protein
VAQEVSIVVETSFPEDVPPGTIAMARFNSPMEEFGLLMELRRGEEGPRDLRIRTHRPLAIYAPPEEFRLWELGRSQSRFSTHRRLLAEDQENAVKAIELDIKRIYVLLYGWIKGRDAECAYLAGDLSEDEFAALTPRVVNDLREKGYRVLDNKPKHFILRTSRRHGGILLKDGKPVYALVDFEFLQRTPEHEKRFKARQRSRYWSLADRPSSESAGAATVPSHLKLVSIFGVSYLFGTGADGGKVWVRGEEPNLFDYFLPDRWRRSPRVKLSPTSEVYWTRTRDSILVVYRRSRVGARPRVDPLVERGKQIREHGYNSPFEEVAIAERLAQMGIRTVRPRAIYRTAHPSQKASYLRDDSRFRDHAGLTTPELPPEPILSPDHDYYTIWDYFRGVHTGSGGSSQVEVLDLERAREEGILEGEEHDDLVARIRSRLRDAGLADGRIDDSEFVVRAGSERSLIRTPGGDVDVTLCLDAVTAYACELLDDDAYRSIIAKLGRKLASADCEMLDMSGSHLLVSMDPDGRFARDEDGDVEVTLCNFELIRGLYRPIR